VPRVPFRGRRPAGAGARTDEETRAHVAGAASAAAAEVAPPPSVRPDPTGAAFFDVDNTMMMGASLFWFARGLAARKYFSNRDMLGFVWQQAKFRIGGNEGNPDDMHTIRENALAFVAGRPVSEIVQASEEIYDELMADRIWAGTRALAQQHLDSGQRVWLVTATPVELASIIAHRLGLTGALGTVAEVVAGKYTGRLVGELMHGPAKAEAVLALAEREGLDLTRCTAYSDSAGSGICCPSGSSPASVPRRSSPACPGPAGGSSAAPVGRAARPRRPTPSGP
jgi:HAD superfamily hydrolase (TIGR01490 family)